MVDITGLLPVLEGWRWVWDLRETTFNVGPGLSVDLMPELPRPNQGLLAYVALVTDKKHARLTIETERMKIVVSPFSANLWDTEYPANIVWIGTYDQTYNIYNLYYAPNTWAPWKSYLRVYVTNPDIDPVTKAQITESAHCQSLVHGALIEDPELFKVSLRDILGTKEELALKRVQL